MSGFLSRVGSKSTISKEFKCTVRLLDDSETLQCEFLKSHTGQYLLDYVCDYLQIVEKDYFGIRFMDNNKYRYWLDLTKPIRRQVRSSNSLVFSFRVKFYPSDPSVIKEEVTRYQLFLQLKRDLLHGRLYCSQNDAAVLGAYVLQADVGDFDAGVHKDGYVSQFKLLLRQNSRLEEKIAQIHQTLKGQVPAVVEQKFLEKASHLDTYGFDLYTVKDAKSQYYLGVTCRGILVFQANRKVLHVPWEKLEKVDYVGKEFVIWYHHLDDQDVNQSAISDQNAAHQQNYGISGDASAAVHHNSASTTLQSRFHSLTRSVAKKKTKESHVGHSNAIDGNPGEKRKVMYLCPSGTFCKHLWKYTLEQRAFFTCPRVADAKPQTSHRRFLLLRGSTFRYSGRVLNEIKEAEAPIREQPVIRRFQLQRQPSRSERGPAWGAGQYATLPRANPPSRPASGDDVESWRELSSDAVAQEAPTFVLRHLDQLSDSFLPDDSADADDSRLSSMPNDSRSAVFDDGGSAAARLTSTPHLRELPVIVTNVFDHSPEASPSGQSATETVSERLKLNGSVTANGKPMIEVGAVAAQRQPAAVERGGPADGGRSLCSSVLLGVLLSAVLLAAVIALMEAPQARRLRVDYPALDAFHHHYYDPVRRQLVTSYAKLAAQLSRKR